MDEVRARIREVFEAPEAAVHLVATGTAANALALACFCPPWAAVYCHRMAHIEEDECGAPEFYTGGAKLVLLDGADARIPPERCASCRPRRGGRAQRAARDAEPDQRDRGRRGLFAAQVAELTAIARSTACPATWTARALPMRWWPPAAPRPR
jgi:threonine aldolase